MVLKGGIQALRTLLLFGLVLLLAGAAYADWPARRQAAELEPAASIDRGGSEPVGPHALAWEITTTAGWPAENDRVRAKRHRSRIVDYQREVIADDIVHYFFKVRIRCGEHDMIGVHRVVREPHPYRPVRTNKTIFLQHGDAKNFVGMYLPGTLSPHTDHDFGMAVFLARNDVDVWGIDQAWTLVPAETTDLSFMQGWGLQRQVDDLRTALGVARLVRLFTGQGGGKMPLSGYSSGVVTGYALLNDEAQRHPLFRHVNGFIPVDFGPVTDMPEWRNWFCGEAMYWQSLIDEGYYGFDTGFTTIGYLARSDPDGPSPIIEGFTNLQTALYFGAGPIFGVGAAHYLAGIWDGGLPVDLRYLSIDQWLDFAEFAPTYEATEFPVDYSTWGCGVTDVPWDDHFADVTVPIFNLAAEGGFGQLSIYTTTLLGSTDVTHLIISLEEPENMLFDFAHIDIFIAENAQELAWEPLLDWLEAHAD